MVAGRRLHPHPASSPPGGGLAGLKGLGDVFRYTRHALELVWSTSRPLTFALAGLTLVAGMLPAGIAWVGARIVDAVVAAIALAGGAGTTGVSHVLRLVALGEAGEAALGADGPEAVAAPGEQLVGVGLVPDVPDDAVRR